MEFFPGMGFTPEQLLDFSAPAASQRTAITNHVLRGLSDALNFGSGQRPSLNSFGDLDSSEQVVNGREKVRKNSTISAVSCNGYVDVAAPLDSGISESGAQYARVYFRAALSLRVEQGDGGSQQSARDDAAKSPDGRFHESSPGVGKGGVGTSNSTFGGDFDEG